MARVVSGVCVCVCVVCGGICVYGKYSVLVSSHVYPHLVLKHKPPVRQERLVLTSRETECIWGSSMGENLFLDSEFE